MCAFTSLLLLMMIFSRAQGEQCNVVPDTIDDIVADIGQEEKETGKCAPTLTHTCSHSAPPFGFRRCPLTWKQKLRC